MSIAHGSGIRQGFQRRNVQMGEGDTMGELSPIVSHEGACQMVSFMVGD